ncbi:hypothetical protein LTR78_005915 [Recurvomyces mirabilis]|uniref:Uncharacterized protein n=1 Tax=Recurvomyces mirabilis TaxID=574656 RepID=A0AAE0WLT1_9PEZI|nr:hypothetical protein LTR78_005915 [Recurvomyces mirabilis]KAK5155275.1 hypothetical protein LTS14_006230 [Recurvomyces mirabilis]
MRRVADWIPRKVTYIQPARADRGLAEKLDILQEMIERLMRTTDQQKHSGEAGRKADDENALMSSAKDILSRGTSLYSASVAGGSVRGQLAAQHRVIEWADTLALLRFKLDISDRSDSPSGQSSPVTGVRVASATTGETSYPEVTENIEEQNDSDSGDEVDLLVANAALGVAVEAFDREDWTNSEGSLKELLSDLQNLSRRQRAKFDLYELQYKLAICAYHTRNTTVAVETFLGLLNEVPATDAHWLHACDVGQCLSLLYVQMTSYENARISCENAMRTRKRLLDKQHRACYDSLALLAHIHELMGQDYRAKKCTAMIPVAGRYFLSREAPDEIVMARSVDGAVPLHEATRNQAGDVISVLLRIEAQQQLRAKSQIGGFTSVDALCYATYVSAGTDSTERGDRGIVRVLLKHGADPHSKNEIPNRGAVMASTHQVERESYSI